MARKSKEEPPLRRSLRGRAAAEPADGAQIEVQTQTQTQAQAKAPPSRSINARARVTTPKRASRTPRASPTKPSIAASSITAAVAPPSPPASATVYTNGAPPDTARSDSLTAADKGFVKTCQNCCHLKIRCIRSTTGQSSPPPCDRCRRLNRQCIYRPARRRFNHALHGRDDQIRVLEARIEELSTSRAPGPPTAPPSAVPPPSVPASASPVHQQEELPEVQAGESDSYMDTQSASQSVRSHPGEQPNLVDDFLLGPERAEQLLDIYRSSMTIHFPFVVVHPAESFQQLRQSKPFLSLAILAVASFHDVALQQSVGIAFKESASHLLTSGEELTLEVLQGLLVFLAWSHYQPRPSRYSQFLQIAIGIVADLRLDRMQGPAAWKTYVGREPKAGVAPHARGLTLEEMRAVAGCSYLSSTISHLLQKFNPFPCNSHVRECCLRLRSAREYETDEYLYHVMELQHFVEQIEPSPHGAPATNGSKTSHFEIMSQLDQTGQLISSELHHVELLVIQYHTAQLFLSQASLFDSSVPLDPSILSQLTSSGLTYAKSLLDFYLSLPLHAEMVFNNTEWIQLSFAITVAARLSVAAKRAAQSADASPLNGEIPPELHLSNMLRHISLRMGALSSGQEPPEGTGDTFRSFERRVQRMQVWFEKFSASTTSEKPVSAAAKNGSRVGAFSYPDDPVTNGHSSQEQQPYPFQDSGVHTSTADYYPQNHTHGSAPDLMNVEVGGISASQGQNIFPELDDLFDGWWSEIDPSLTFQ